MFTYFYSWLVSFWYRDIKNKLDEDWVAIDSNQETKLAILTNREVKRELNSIREGSVFDRQRIYVTVNELVSSLIKLETTYLPSDLRRKVYKDVFTSLSPNWLNVINRILPSINLEESRWLPTTYEKNMLGQIVDMAEQTGPEELSTNGLVQMIRAVHRCLVQSLNAEQNKVMEKDESKQILDMVVESLEPILELWLKTVKLSENTLNKQGRLPKLWNNQKEKERQRLEEIKEKGQLDGRYEDGSYDPLINSGKEKQEVKLLDKDTMIERSKSLELNLSSILKGTKMPRNKPDIKKTSSHVSTDFKAKKDLIEKLLSSRLKNGRPQ